MADIRYGERSEAKIENKGSTLTRREVMALGAVAGVAVVGGVAAKMMMGGETAPTSDTNTELKAVTLEQSRVALKELPAQSPDLFPEGIDPNAYLEYSYEQLVEAGRIKVTEENKNDINVFGTDLIRVVNNLLAVANSREGLLKAIGENVRVGVRDEMGLRTDITDGYPEYVNGNFGVPMLESIPDNMDGHDITSTKKALLLLQNKVTGRFVGRATSMSEPTLDTAAYLSNVVVQELPLEDGHYPNLTGAKRANLNFQIEQTDGEPVDSSLLLTYIEDADTKSYLLLFEDYELPIGGKVSA